MGKVECHSHVLHTHVLFSATLLSVLRNQIKNVEKVEFPCSLLYTKPQATDNFPVSYISSQIWSKLSVMHECSPGH